MKSPKMDINMNITFFFTKTENCLNLFLKNLKKLDKDQRGMKKKTQQERNGNN